MKQIVLKILLSSVFIRTTVDVMLATMRYLAQRSDNTLDDEIVDIVEQALKPEKPVEKI